MAKFRWTFERGVAVANVVALLVGATLAAIDWYPQWRTHMDALFVSALTPTQPASSMSVDDLKVFPDGTHLYHVKYNVETKNLSNKPVEITYSIAQIYVGQLEDSDLPDHGVYEINESPNIWDSAGTGQIRWALAGYDASQIDGGAPAKVKEFFEKKNIEDRSPGGGMTGVVAPGDSTGTSPEFVIRAKPGEYIDLFVGYGIDDAVASPDSKINMTSDMWLLTDSLSPKAAGAAIPPKTSPGSAVKPSA